MEHRRLRLHQSGSDSGHTLAPERGRVAVPGRCLAIADTENGASAVHWALSVTEELGGLGRHVPVVFTGFGAVPELERETAARFAQAGALVWLRGSLAETEAAHALARELSEVAGRAVCWLLVGEPALTAFDAPLTVLLTGGRAPQLWSPALRALRGGVSLELPSARERVARALARSLVPTPAA